MFLVWGHGKRVVLDVRWNGLPLAARRILQLLQWDGTAAMYVVQWKWRSTVLDMLRQWTLQSL
jgi:hypothetical protein